MTDFLICIRLLDGSDGQWMAIQTGRIPEAVWFDGRRTELVATGDVEWDTRDRCAEIYVPADRLDQWRAEHAVDR